MPNDFEPFDLVEAPDGELLVGHGRVVDPRLHWWVAVSVQRPQMGLLQVSPLDHRRVANLKELPKAGRALRAYAALHQGQGGTDGHTLSALVEELEAVFRPLEDDAFEGRFHFSDVVTASTAALPCASFGPANSSYRCAVDVEMATSAKVSSFNFPSAGS